MVKLKHGECGIVRAKVHLQILMDGNTITHQQDSYILYFLLVGGGTGDPHPSTYVVCVRLLDFGLQEYTE